MTWRLAKSLSTLRAEVNHRWPKRCTVSDGTIGDTRHANRKSDHNPWVHDGEGYGVVTALDITNDPATGPDAHKLALALVASKDKRIKYVISCGHIYNHAALDGHAAWAPRSYHGSNGHYHHVHVSVKPDMADYDDTSPWHLEATEAPTAAKAEPLLLPKEEAKATPAPPMAHHSKSWSEIIGEVEEKIEELFVLEQPNPTQLNGMPVQGKKTI